MLRKLPVLAFSCVLVVFAAGLTGQAATYRGGAHARPLVAGPIDEARLTVLGGNTNFHATAANDRGALGEGFPLEHMQLVLQRPPELEKELESLIAEQQDKSSPQYHKWLTASQFGSRFGVAASDVERVSDWLTSQGFHVDSVLPSGMAIEFSGTAGQVKKAFHTEIHHLDVKGVSHISNMSDPQIPAALAGVVKGVHSLNDFMPHTMYKKRSKYTFTSGGSTYEAIVPADLATIYNLNPAFAAGHTGAGQTVVVIEDTDVYSASDISTFRSTFGLSGYSGTFTQVHPTGGSSTCSAPGVVSGNEGEAELDAEWAGASAPNAAIELASCSDTLTVFGGLIALQNLLTASSVPQIVSISYGECEAENGSSANASFFNTYQQAATQGVSVFVSSGDESAASCDADESKATHGIAVSGFASTPYNVAVGGTDYGDSYEGTNSTYWSSTNTGTYGSAISYIPEIPWNDSCASQLLATSNGFAQTYGSSGFCNSSTGEADYLTTGSGSGGPSGCYSGTPTTRGVVSGTCAGQPKPSWQSVLGNPADSVRDIPDVSLFAANGVWAHYYPYCDSDTGDNESCSGDPSAWSGAGGTSFSSPILAGMQALINQAHATSGSGNPNPRYYALGSLEFGTTGSASCNSSNGNGVGSTCVFYDVTLGDMDVNCTGTHNCYRPSGTNGVLSTSNTAYDPAYGTQTGWDFATGLGTVNAYNLIRDWDLVQTVTTLVSSSNPSTTGQRVTYTATVTPDIGSSETGTVTWSSNTGCATSTLSSGVATCAVTWSSSGSETVTATYGGDTNYAGSTASVVQTVSGASGSAVSLSSTSIAFGNVSYGATSGTQTVTLTNTGGATLTFTGIAVSGTNASAFTFANTCGTSLAAGANCTIHGHFAPSSIGAETAAITITDNAANSPQSISLSGTGTGSAVSLSPTSLSFGNVAVGATSSSQTVTLTNTGNSALTITSIAVTGAGAASYTFANSCGTSLAAGADCTIHGHFAPTGIGSQAAAITITDKASNSPQSIALSGTGTGGAVSLSATSLSFGGWKVGTTSGSQTVTLTNTGNATLSITSIALTGADASSFTFANTCGSSLAAGANCTVHGHFDPTTTGALTAAITITDKASDSPQSIALTGTGQ